MPQPRCFVRYRTSLTPILRMTSGCALTHGPRAATSRSIASSTSRVRAFVDRIDPHQHAVAGQKLGADLVGIIVGVDRRLSVNAERDQFFENAAITIVVRCRGTPRLPIAAPEDGYPIAIRGIRRAERARRGKRLVCSIGTAFHVHAQSPRNVERCTELGRKPSDREPAFPECRNVKPLRSIVQAGRRRSFRRRNRAHACAFQLTVDSTLGFRNLAAVSAFPYGRYCSSVVWEA